MQLSVTKQYEEFLYTIHSAFLNGNSLYNHSIYQHQKINTGRIWITKLHTLFEFQQFSAVSSLFCFRIQFRVSQCNFVLSPSPLQLLALSWSCMTWTWVLAECFIECTQYGSISCFFIRLRLHVLRKNATERRCLLVHDVTWLYCR